MAAVLLHRSLSTELADAAATFLSLAPVPLSPPPQYTEEYISVASTSTLPTRPRAPSRSRRSLEDLRFAPSAPPSEPSTSGALLRRCSSVVDGFDPDDSDDDAADFSSDEEPWHGLKRPPSLTSSLNSQRSSRLGIQIEDQSDRPTATFARNVSIRGFHLVGERASSASYIAYDCEVVTKEGTILRILKRFSAFVQLRSDLVQTFPHLRQTIPHLPPRSALGKFRSSFLERRRTWLGYWLSVVLLNSETGGSGVVRAWILE